MSEEEQTKFDIEQVDKCIKILSEHFDDGQVFVSRNVGESDGNTVSVKKGWGNYFSRYSQIKHWVIREEEATRAEQHKPEDSE